MKVWIKNTGKAPGCLKKDKHLLFFCSRPTVIQPSEIIRAQTDTFIKVEQNTIITLVTHSSLSGKACELFPGTIIIDANHDYSKPLEIPLRNCGRNQTNKMPGEPLALGYVSFCEEIELEDLDLSLPSPAEQNSVPQKKNVGIRFEIK